MNWHRSFYQKHRELFLYMLFGLITTVVSLGACYATLKIGVVFIHDENGEPTELLDILASSTQWVSGVLVAFVTNKKWVFNSGVRENDSTLGQLGRFAGGRVATYFLEVAVNLGSIAAFEALGYVPFSLIGVEFTGRVWAKLISSVIIVISNYFLSKLFVFKKATSD